MFAALIRGTKGLSHTPMAFVLGSAEGRGLTGAEEKILPFFWVDTKETDSAPGDHGPPRWQGGRGRSTQLSCEPGLGIHFEQH